MPRMKKTTKRTREESSVEPPPWNHPLARYFASNEDLVYYEMRLAGRKEIPPRDKYYPDLVAIAYSTLMIEVNEENESDFSLVFKLGKDEYKLGCSELAIIWGLHNQGCLFEGGKTLLMIGVTQKKMLWGSLISLKVLIPKFLAIQ
ncbi:hypothetical protein PIB30_103977 [Stylosanthes scabra]|uniref:Uncharacterized protein n=1 Tax=Stylosanthes scabra TaxID=79078 RepID=A0ABU6UX25_9FABA|nr:hypothetical protein [Stylosanthes scabra]